VSGKLSHDYIRRTILIRYLNLTHRLRDRTQTLTVNIVSGPFEFRAAWYTDANMNVGTTIPADWLSVTFAAAARNCPRRGRYRNQFDTGSAGIDRRTPCFRTRSKAGCARRRETAAAETLVYARRYEPEKKPGPDPKVVAPEVSISAGAIQPRVLATRRIFPLRNLPPGSYRIDPRRRPAAGT